MTCDAREVMEDDAASRRGSNEAAGSANQVPASDATEAPDSPRPDPRVEAPKWVMLANSRECDVDESWPRLEEMRGKEKE